MERILQKQCNDTLRQLGVEFFHFDFAKNKKVCPKNFKGYPDLTVFLKNGRTIFIELKADKGELSDDQIEKHKRILKLGFDCYVVKDYDNFIDILKGYL